MGNLFGSRTSPKETDHHVAAVKFFQTNTKAALGNAVAAVIVNQPISDWQALAKDFPNPPNFSVHITSVILYPILLTSTKELYLSVKNNKWIFQTCDHKKIIKTEHKNSAVLFAMMFECYLEGIAQLNMYECEIVRNCKPNMYQWGVRWLSVKRMELSEIKTVTGSMVYKHMKQMGLSKKDLHALLKKYLEFTSVTNRDDSRSFEVSPKHIDNHQIAASGNSRSSDESEDVSMQNETNKDVELPHQVESKRQEQIREKNTCNEIPYTPEQQTQYIVQDHRPPDHQHIIQVDSEHELTSEVECIQNCGLWNSGNSCYMNSILQCLCRSTQWKDFDNNQHGSDFLLKEFLSLMKNMTSMHGSLDTHGLKKAVSKYSQRFATKNQQDAHEFLTFLLVKLSEQIQCLSEESMRQSCVIQNNFIGELQNKSKFDCIHDVTTTQPFFTVSLPLDTSQVDPLTVENCLSTFLEEEVMDTEAYCNECRKMVGCTLKLSFESLPRILVLHLKKFDFFRLKKLDVDVKYPFEGLEVSTSSGKLCSYDLFGICNHFGTLRGGHYTADVKSFDSGNWYSYNDDRVQCTTVDKLESHSRNAYILFYKRIDECTKM